MEDEESRQRQVISVAQTIAMQAMELPAQERSRFIHRAVTAIRRDFDRLIEESGGSVGQA